MLTFPALPPAVHLPTGRVLHEVHYWFAAFGTIGTPVETIAMQSNADVRVSKGKPTGGISAAMSHHHCLPKVESGQLQLLQHVHTLYCAEPVCGQACIADVPYVFC